MSRRPSASIYERRSGHSSLKKSFAVQRVLRMTAHLMTRKDSEKDSERPHYYSQFWLDVAAGRRIIGAPKPEDGEAAEPDLTDLPFQRKGRASQVDFGDGRATTDGYSDTIVHPVADPILSSDEVIEPEADVESYASADDLDFQDTAVEEADIPDMDLTLIEDEDEDEDSFIDGEEEDEDEEDDDIGWGGGRTRKKPRATRPTKPAAKKPGSRTPRRGY